LFGKDARERFLVMCTFSDGKTPLTESTILAAGLEVAKFYKFENKAIFEKNGSDGIDHLT
jgi:hypothetical protein